MVNSSHLYEESSFSFSFFIAFEFTGLGRGGQQIQKAKEVYTKAVETLVELASLQVRSKTCAKSSSLLSLSIDSICYPGRSYQSYQSSCERD